MKGCERPREKTMAAGENNGRGRKQSRVDRLRCLSVFYPDRSGGRAIRTFCNLDGFGDADSSVNGLPTTLNYHPIAVLGNLLENAATAPSAIGTWFLLKSSTQGL